jgi:cyclic pyranopterin phosphate synthase
MTSAIDRGLDAAISALKMRLLGFGTGKTMSDTIVETLINVEIEVNSRCNRRCWYCPVSILPPPDTPKFMADDVFIRLHDELRRLNYSGRISYHLLSEPLLRKDLPRLVSLSKSALPAAKQVVFTNGDLLTDERYDDLMEVGVDLIVITSHDGVEHERRKNQIVQFPHHLQLTNRGGNISALPAATEDILQLPCHAPSEMLIVTSSGNVLLCYEDSKREHVYGNIMRSSLEEIWMAPAFVERRLLVSEGRRAKAAGICGKCSNTAHVEPGRSASSEPFWTDPGALD